MTDNEIIKALECCVNNGDCRECALNPKKGNYGYCTGLAIKSALDLITRQKAEIERLQLTVDSFTDIGKLYSEIKAEAYKEFAEKLCDGRVSNDNTVILAKCLLKEMVGDNNAN
jgi:hypothetical protein